MATTTKPAIPEYGGFDIERIPLDESENSPFQGVVRIAAGAVDRWYLGPDGPYKQTAMTPAQAVRAMIAEGLAHLLELGLLDIDVPRLAALVEAGVPMDRRPR